MENIRTIKSFRISKSMYGKGLVISIPSQGFFYNHDEVFHLAANTDKSKDRTHKVDRATMYSMTKGFPTWAKSVIFKGGFEK